MKDLTEEEFMDAPDIVQFIYAQTMYGFPVGMTVYKQAVEQHPEYFPEEEPKKEEDEKL